MTEAERSPWFYVNLLEPVLVQVLLIDLFLNSIISENDNFLKTLTDCLTL